MTEHAPGAAGTLAGLRVLDLSRVLAGPLCTQLLADHGAEVIKVEAPAGDETRRWGPPFITATMSAYFSGLNRNKENLCLDLATAPGRAVLDVLLADADVLVENYKVGTLARWGWPDDSLSERFPALIHCRITGFGVDGPMGAMPGYDAVAQACSGLMSINGEPDGPPLRVGVPVVDMVTGIYAFSGVLLALQDRNRTGLGQLVDCTLLDTAISLLHPHSATYLADGHVPRRTGSAHPTVAPYDTFEAADGLIFIGAGSDRQFGQLAKVLGLPGLLCDRRFTSNPDRVRNAATLRPLLARRVAALRRHDLARDLLAAGVPAAAVLDVAEALSDPQVVQRDMVVALGSYRAAGIPIKLSRTPGSVRAAPRERGADTGAIFARLGFSPEQADEFVAQGIAARAEADPA